jgi:GTP pyrophosphokinase
LPTTSNTTTSAGTAALDSLTETLRLSGHAAIPIARGLEVAHIVFELTGDPILTRASLLATVLSTSEAKTVPALLRNAAGPESLRLVEKLRQLGNLELDERWNVESLAPAQAEILRKMLLAVVGDPRLVVTRLAAQLVRARHAKSETALERRWMAQEIRELYAPLANRLGVWSIKWELEDLAFRELQPADYHQIADALHEKRQSREIYIREVCATLMIELHRAGIAAEVQGRPKHIYSIYRKMQRKQLAFEQVFDIRAVRIIVPTVAECYAALSAVHALWPFLQSEFDDYIATPKDNHYQSIHTAVTGPDGRPLEIQIRTHQMQAQSEQGVAAHWRYKEGGGDRRYDAKIQQVRQLLEGVRTGADELERISAGLFVDRIYAMTPKGEVVDLPKGGTPLDFAFHVHSDLGERCRGAKVNGRIVPFAHQLANGDVVEIITGKESAPSRDWLATGAGFLASSRSRSKLRAYFRRQDDELAAATPAKALPAPEPTRSTLQARTRKPIRSGKSPIQIDGVGDLPITLARCCAPVRPQGILGYLTVGRGVTIHRSECPGLLRMIRGKPQRLLKVEWSIRDDVRLPMRIEIEAFDRRGLLRDISDLIAEEHLSIEGVSSHTDPDNRIARFEVRLSVKDITELAKLQRQLSRIPNVYKVRRAR